MPSAKNPSPRQRRHCLLPLVFTLAAALAASAQAGTYEAFGPQDVVHPRGQPTTETFDFDVLEPGGPYLLQIRNGGTGGELGRVAQGSVWLNGTLVVRPFDSWRHEPVIEKPVALAAGNTLTIELAGRAGGVSIAILGNDDTPPEITATVSPEPNAAGWHRGAVTVSFDCSDTTSGIASCSGPVVLADEGANQIVTGQAVDLAGNTSQASASVSIDLTPPVVQIFSPVDGSTIPGFGFTAEGSVWDTLSGVDGAELDGSPLDLDPAGAFSREIDVPDAGTYPFEVTAVDVAGNPAAASFEVIQEKTEYLEIDVVLPSPGAAVSIQRASGWPLVVRLSARNLLGIGVASAPLFPGLVPDGLQEPSWLVFDLGPDGFFSPFCGYPPFSFLGPCNPPPDGEGEVFLEFTLDSDRAGVEDLDGNDEVRALTLSGEAGIPQVLAENPLGVSPRTYGPVTGGGVTDGYGYGPNDDLPGLVVLSDAGPGVFFTEAFDLVEPRRARNLSGFFDQVTYELSSATTVVASMAVPRNLFSALTLYDVCSESTPPGECVVPPLLPVKARTDGGPIDTVSTEESQDQQNAREVTLRIFAVNGVAPLTLDDQNGDGVVDARDASLAEFELLSRETVIRFRQFYDPPLDCPLGAQVADFRFFDLDASGQGAPDSVNCEPGAGGLVDPP